MKLPKPADSGADFVVPEEGLYRMEFTGYDEPVLSTFKKKSGDDQYRIKLVFTIRDDESEYDGAEIFAWYGYSMHPKAKLYPVVKAMLGREIDEDEDVDIDELVGTFIMGTLDNTTKTGENGPRTYANLVAVAPIRKKKKSAPEPPPKVKKAAVEDDGDDLFDDEDEDAA